MKKIYYIISTLIITFLLIAKFNVKAMTIPNVSQIKFYNLIWELRGSWGDMQEYRLSIEVEPGQYETLHYVATTEVENLNLYGVIVFQYPVFKNHSLDERTVYYRRNSNSEFQHFKDVEFIALKKLSNKCELYIKNDGVIHTLDFFPGSSDLGGTRITYYIPDYTYEDGYNEGYNDGYLNGIEAGYRDGEEKGYNMGFDDGYNQGYTNGEEAGYNQGYEQGHNAGYQAGYNAGINEQLEDKDFTNLLKSVFIAIGSFLGINLLPGISIGAIIAVPIVFGIISFILGRKKD